MNVLELYQSEKNWTFAWQPDIPDIEDIIAMEWLDNLIWKNDSVEQTKPSEEQPNEEKTTEVDNTETTESKVNENPEPEEKDVDNWNEKSKVDNEEQTESNEQSADENTEPEDVEEITKDDVDIDEIIKQVESADINMDLVKQLEQIKLDKEELATKYEILKRNYDKLLEEKAALEAGETVSEIPAKLKWVVRLYERFDAGDESAKQQIIDSLAWLLTELTGKDIYKYISGGNAWDVTDIADIEAMSGSVSSWSNTLSTKSVDEDEIDPIALREFWIEF